MQNSIFQFSTFEFSKVNVEIHDLNCWIQLTTAKNVLMGRANHILVKYVHDCNLLSTFIGCNSFKFAFLFAFLQRGALLKTTSYDSLYRSEQYFLAKTFCLKVFLPKNAVELKNRIVGCSKWYKKPLLDWFPKMRIEFQKFQFLNQKRARHRARVA